MALQSLIRLLFPKEDHFYTFLERQADTAVKAARALATFSDGKTASEVCDAVQTLEHEGDEIISEMMDALAKTFVTPIDREDLHSISTQLDDITDLINSVARLCSLYRVERPSEPMTQLMQVLVKSTAILAETMPNLRKHDYARVIEDSRKVKALEKEADAVFRKAVHALFNDTAIDTKVLFRDKEVLEHLETAANQCDFLGVRLANLAVKHG